MADRYWTTPEESLREFSKREKDCCLLYYEIAPTGPLHAGILRTLLRMDEVRLLICKNGFKVTEILGIGDRNVLKNQVHFPNYNNMYINSQLVDIPNPISCRGNYYDYFCEDIYRTIERYHIGIDRYVRIGDLYKSDSLKKIFGKLYENQSDILDILARSQRHLPALFFPKCESCGKMYYCGVDYINQDGQGKYKCCNCGYKGACSIFTNSGAFTFKLELALIWKWLNVDFYFAGQDHYNAIATANQIYKVLYGCYRVIPYIINLTITDGKHIAHKSFGNYRPVLELDQQEGEELVELLNRTPDKILLTLPKKFQPDLEGKK